MDEYSLVVQELFEDRVKTWLETVGKDVFFIKHFWGRMEFSPGRGQIHCHLLAICGDQSYNMVMHKLKGNKVAQATFLQTWASKAYNYTAEVDMETFNAMKIGNDDSPCSERLSEVDDVILDGQRVLRFCQNHSCSGYCLRCPKKKKKGTKQGSDTKRSCRSGAGEEATAGQGDTPGFELRDEPVIIHDPRGV